MDLKIISKVLFDALKIDKLKLPKSNVLTFACDNDRYIDYNGKKYSPLINTIEEILAECGIECVSITRIASTIKGSLSHGKVYSQEGKFARAMLAKRVKGLFLSKNNYPFSWMEKKIWDEILDQTEAKVVVAILPSRELCSSCRERGIWVCDIQHGVIANEHYWYGSEFRQDDPVNWLPNAFLVWDHGSHEVISKWAKNKNVDVKITGNPWVDRFKNKKPNDTLVENLKEKYKIQKKDKKSALLTLSWGGHGLENKFIHPSLEKYIKNSREEIEWRIRLHPNQVQGFASDEGREFLKYFNNNLKEIGVEYENSTAMPLPLLLANVDYHVTWLSSVCMEAAYFGVPSLALAPKIQQGSEYESYYNYLCELGYVTKLMPTYENIEEWFERRKSLVLSPYQDYSKNFKTVMNDIINKVA